MEDPKRSRVHDADEACVYMERPPSPLAFFWDPFSVSGLEACLHGTPVCRYTEMQNLSPRRTRSPSPPKSPSAGPEASIAEAAREASQQLLKSKKCILLTLTHLPLVLKGTQAS